MPTRDTHTRIYQGELSKWVSEELMRLARQHNTSAQALILEAIGAYLKNGELASSLDVELIEINSSRVRCYLWLPDDYVR